MTEEQELSDLIGIIGALDGRLGDLNNRLEVLAAMVETPPPLEDRMESLELRQNLVESPVMLRIADALEKIANDLPNVGLPMDWVEDNGFVVPVRQVS